MTNEFAAVSAEPSIDEHDQRASNGADRPGSGGLGSFAERLGRPGTGSLPIAASDAGPATGWLRNAWRNVQPDGSAPLEAQAAPPLAWDAADTDVEAVPESSPRMDHHWTDPPPGGPLAWPWTGDTAEAPLEPFLAIPKEAISTDQLFAVTASFAAEGLTDSLLAEPNPTAERGDADDSGADVALEANYPFLRWPGADDDQLTDNDHREDLVVDREPWRTAHGLATPRSTNELMGMPADVAEPTDEVAPDPAQLTSVEHSTGHERDLGSVAVDTAQLMTLRQAAASLESGRATTVTTVAAPTIVPDRGDDIEVQVVSESPTHGVRGGLSAPSWWRQPLTWRVLGIAIVTRILLALVAWPVVRAVGPTMSAAESVPARMLGVFPVLEGWTRADTVRYVAVAQSGYGPADGLLAGNLGVLPLYPLLMRAGVALFGGAPTTSALTLSGVVIANLSFLVAVVLIARLTAERFGRRVGVTAALLLCVAPFSFVLTMPTSDALFLALGLGSLLLGNRGRWRWAAALAGLAAATQFVGLALLPALAVLAAQRRARVRDLLGIALLAPAGVLVYFGMVSEASGGSLAALRARLSWEQWYDQVWVHVGWVFTDPARMITGDVTSMVVGLNLLLGLLCLLLLPWVWHRLDPAIALFTTLLVLSQFLLSWESLGQRLMAAVGIFMVLAALLDGAPEREDERVGTPIPDPDQVTEPRWGRDLMIASSASMLVMLMMLAAAGI